MAAAREESGAMRRQPPFLRVFLGGLGLILLGTWLCRSDSQTPEVVVYCAHDAIFADQMLKLFEQRSGIQVRVLYDEEASKSLGLTQRILAERTAPQCDVFWNNQTLGTERLRRAGVLQPCSADWCSRIPARFRAADLQWVGFAARLRVWIFGTANGAWDQQRIDALMGGDSLASVAIAVPLFGTTLTHYTELCHRYGLDSLQAWHASLQERGIREVRGNGAVRDLVAAGVCELGLTDTDDAFAAMDAGSAVGILPVRLADDATICIPNTVAMIRNCPHPEAAGELIRFLLSAEAETLLANSSARQIPLGPVDETQLSEAVRQLLPFAAAGGEPAAAAAEDERVLKWLQGLYTAGVDNSG